MRKIEREMIDAVRERRTWHGRNTAVIAYRNGVQVTLHGNVIATVLPGAAEWTLAGWNTPTTRSRINALASAFGWRHVTTIKGTPHVYESAGDPSGLTIRRPIDSHSWVRADK